MREMISGTISKIKEDFIDEIKNANFCSLKTIRFDQDDYPDYTDKKIQLLYLLRYYPAYLCEYKYLYDKVIKKSKLDNLSILSIGCGCCVDYHGAYLANERDYNNITYCGIDRIEWEYADSFGNKKFEVINEDINNIKLPDKNDYNIIIFPKSISEFNDKSFNNFISALSKTTFTQETVVLISSSMDKGFEHDEERYKKVAEVLEKNGYFCRKYEATCEISGKNGLKKLDNDFNYPNDIKEFITSLSTRCPKYIANKKNCKEDCSTQLDKWPILSSKYISFIINSYKKDK
jgi:hypothetical protein